MKIKLTTLILGLALLFTTQLKSQDFLDSIAITTCNCSNKLDSSLTGETLTMQTGVCIMEAIEPFEEELKAYLKIEEISFSDVDLMQKIGEIVGLKMLKYCPDFLMRLTSNASDEEEETVSSPPEEDGLQLLNVKVTKVDIDQFITFTVESQLVDDAKKRHKLIWLSDFLSSSVLIDNYEQLQGKSCSFSYTEIDLFDPRIQEFRTFNVITGFKLLKND